MARQNEKSKSVDWKHRGLLDLGSNAAIFWSALSSVSLATLPWAIVSPTFSSYAKSSIPETIQVPGLVVLSDLCVGTLFIYLIFWLIPFCRGFWRLSWQANKAGEVLDRNQSREYSVAIEDLDNAKELKTERNQSRIWRLIAAIICFQQFLLFAMFEHFDAAIIALSAAVASMILFLCFSSFSDLAVAKRYLASVCNERDENLPNANKGEIKDLLDRIKSLEEKIREENG